MTRDEIAQSVMAAKLARGLSWQDLADSVSKPVGWVVAGLLGKQPLDLADAATLAAMLGLPERAAPILAATPMPGTVSTAVRTRPTVDQVYEVLSFYGPR